MSTTRDDRLEGRECRRATRTAADRKRAAAWLTLAIGSLGLAGLLATLLVIARAPAIAPLVRDPGFFKRCLVVHVDLALAVWFHAFTAALFVLVPSRVRANPIGRHAALAAGIGAVMLVLAAFAGGAKPVLSNYVPVVDHWLFLAGLSAIGLGLAFTFLDAKLLPRTEEGPMIFALPPAAIVGLRAAAISILLALMTFVASAIALPAGLAPEARFERLMWGGGHVLQFASVATMLAVWTILISRATGKPPIQRSTATWLFAVLVTPTFAAPILAITGNHVGFTRLMQWGIAPAVLVYLVLCIRALGKAPLSPHVLSFGASAVLTVLGFVLGASIRGPNTTIPAHYHASIGAVTVSLMAMTPLLLRALGARTLGPRLSRIAGVQPALLGLGQSVFAIGFALAGAHGMARKAYGSEQQVRTFAESLGLYVMGLGGAVAVASGFLFLFVVGAMVRRPADSKTSKRGDAWRGLPPRTRSNV